MAMLNSEEFAKYSDEISIELNPRWMEEDRITAERGVIGCVLIDETCLPEVRSIVNEKMFSDPAMKEAFRVACAMQDDGEEFDIVILGDRVARQGFEWTNAFSMLLIDETVSATNARAYCDILKREYERKELLQSMNRFRRELLSGSEPEDVKAGLTSYIEQESESGFDNRAVTQEEATTEFLNHVLDAQEGRMEPTISTGYEKLDFVLAGGFQRNGYYVLAARPGRGKTALALNIAYRVAARGKRVLFVSLEMDREQLIARIVASKVGSLGPAQILNGKFHGQDLTDKVVNATTEIAKLPIVYNLSVRMNVEEIKYLTRVSKAEFIVIDYLGLVSYENEKGRPYEEVTKISRQLKLLAKSVGSPILCLAQLNRESEKRSNHRPILSDLRETGAIEQDADGVLLNMPVPDDSDEEEWANDGSGATSLTVIVAKNRHGATGDVEMNWYKESGNILEVGERM